MYSDVTIFASTGHLKLSFSELFPIAGIYVGIWDKAWNSMLGSFDLPSSN